MIVFDLKCANDHPFEGWFADSGTFAEQQKAGEVVCPLCGDTQVGKALMTPNVRTGKGRPEQAAPASARGPGNSTGGPSPATKGDYEQTAKLLQAMKKLRGEVEKNCDYVGKKFAEEARKIHYGEVEQHNIYGETSAEEAQALNEEGVEFGVLPWPDRKDS
ncbi:MAG: DUF1178 family protein [Proteobacteria bacterium]|nr:DUF1178 family protein [Pseudomonadota bacterium]